MHQLRERTPGLNALAIIACIACGVFYSDPADARIQTLLIDQGDGRVPSFYNWSSKLPKTHGSLLRKAPLEKSLALPGSRRGYRILYTSTDGISGKTIVAVSGALFLPIGTPPKEGWPLVAWAHGTVGLADICAPSVQGRSLRDISYLARWLSEGFAIVATDYQGLGTPGPHPYENPRSEAYSVLDSIRAAQTAGARISKKTVIVGHSQGGQAAFAAGLYAKQYTPDLDIRGIVATGAPNYTTQSDLSINLANTWHGYDPTVYHVLYLLLMGQQTDPTIQPSQVLTQAALPLFTQVRSVCSARLEFDVDGAGLNRDNAFAAGGPLKVLGPLTARMGYPTFSTNIPVFMGIGGSDEEVPAPGQLDLARKACAAGTVVVAHLYANTSHGGSVNKSLSDSIPFVKQVLAGTPVIPICAPTAQ